MIIEMLHVLEDIYENKLDGNHIYKYCDALQEGVRSKNYKPLLTRNKCSKFHDFNHFYHSGFDLNSRNAHNPFNIIATGSLENRIQHYAKKRRIDLINADEASQRKQDLSNRNQTNNEKMTIDE